MKALIAIALVAMFLVLVVVITVPDDDRCLDECTDQVAGDLTAYVPVILKRSAFMVEHHTIYTTVVNRWTGQTVAVCCFGNVFNIE